MFLIIPLGVYAVIKLTIIGRLAMTALVIFLVSYLGIAMGRIPGLALDRVGIAILGPSPWLPLVRYRLKRPYVALTSQPYAFCTD